MNKQHISAFLAISRLAFSSGAIAQNMSESEYKTAGKNIMNEYSYDQLKCGSFFDNDKNICMAVAKNKEKVAKTKLEEHYRPANNSDYKVSAARVKTDYAVAV
jgi:hypothetical protein